MDSLAEEPSLGPPHRFFSMINYLFKNKSRDNYSKYNLSLSCEIILIITSHRQIPPK